MLKSRTTFHSSQNQRTQQQQQQQRNEAKKKSLQTNTKYTKFERIPSISCMELVSRKKKYLNKKKTKLRSLARQENYFKKIQNFRNCSVYHWIALRIVSFRSRVIEFNRSMCIIHMGTILLWQWTPSLISFSINITETDVNGPWYDDVTAWYLKLEIAVRLNRVFFDSFFHRVFALFACASHFTAFLWCYSSFNLTLKRTASFQNTTVSGGIFDVRIMLFVCVCLFFIFVTCWIVCGCVVRICGTLHKCLVRHSLPPCPYRYGDVNIWFQRNVYATDSIAYMQYAYMQYAVCIQDDDGFS